MKLSNQWVKFYTKGGFVMKVNLEKIEESKLMLDKNESFKVMYFEFEEGITDMMVVQLYKLLKEK